MISKESKRNSWQGNGLSNSRAGGNLQKLEHGEHRKTADCLGPDGGRVCIHMEEFECYPHGNGDPQLIRWSLERLLYQFRLETERRVSRW